MRPHPASPRRPRNFRILTGSLVALLGFGFAMASGFAWQTTHRAVSPEASITLNQWLTQQITDDALSGELNTLRDNLTEAGIGEQPLSTSHFAIATIASLVIASVGLVITGSGGPSIWLWFLFPVSALMSMPGMGLRYGRGRFFTRMLYWLSGSAMLAGGYFLTFHEGRLFDPGFGPGLLAASMALGWLGSAAVLGVLANGVWGSRGPTQAQLASQMVELAGPPDRNVSQQLRRAAAAAGETPPPGLRSDPTIVVYQDPPISVADDGRVPAVAGQISAAFVNLDFEQPLVVDVGSDDEISKHAIQVGCRNMVLAITIIDSHEGDQDATYMRLFSVLENGQVVTSLSRGAQEVAQTRDGRDGVIVLVDSDDAAKMLATHLELTVARAESLSTQIVKLHPGDWREVYAYVHRVMFDIGHQHGDNGFKILPSTHGRFAFPVQPVQPIETMAV